MKNKFSTHLVCKSAIFVEENSTNVQELNSRDSVSLLRILKMILKLQCDFQRVIIVLTLLVGVCYSCKI